MQLVVGGQGRRRSVDLRFFRPALSFWQIAVNRDNATKSTHELRFVERLKNSSFTVRAGGSETGPGSIQPGHNPVVTAPIVPRRRQDQGWGLRLQRTRAPGADIDFVNAVGSSEPHAEVPISGGSWLSERVRGRVKILW